MKRHWAELVRRLQTSLVWRIVVAALEIRLYDRALTIAGQAFIALVPLLIVLASLFGSADSQAISNRLIEQFALSGASADAVRLLFVRPPDATGGLTILSWITLLVSASSFARSIQRTYETAWQLPARGFRRTVDGIQGACVLLVVLFVLALLSSLASRLPGGSVTALIAQAATAVPAWWLATRLLLNRRVAWRLLLPGAVVSAIAQVAVSSVGSTYVPYLIERNTERYGVIGVAIALISWLVVLALLVVVSAVVGAQLGAALAARDKRKE
jgi:membrane protein